MTSATSTAVTRRSLLAKLSTGAALAVAGLGAGAALSDEGNTSMRITEPANHGDAGADAQLLQLADRWIELDDRWLALCSAADDAIEAAYRANPPPEALRWRKHDARLAYGHHDDLAFWTVGDIGSLERSGSHSSARRFTQRGKEVLASFAAWQKRIDRAQSKLGILEIEATTDGLFAEKKTILRQIAALRPQSATGLMAKGRVLAKIIPDAEGELSEGLSSDALATDDLLTLSLARDCGALLQDRGQRSVAA